MKKYSILYILILLCIITKAQNSLDIITISGQGVLPSSYASTYTGKVNENFINANLKLPVVLSERLIWYNDVNYYQYHINSKQTSPDVFNKPLKIHGTILQSGLITKLNDKNSIIMFFVPRLMGNLEHSDNQNFQFGVIGLYERKYNVNLTMRYGASYNNELFGPYVVPLVYLNWNVTNNIFIRGMLPIYSKIGLHVNDKLDIGIHHLGLVTSFNITKEKEIPTYIERNSIDVSLFTRYKLTKNIHIESKIGYSVGRSYAQYINGDKVTFGLPLYKFEDNREQLNEDFESGLFAQIKFAYSILLDK